MTRLLPVLLALLLAVAGCGGGDDAATDRARGATADQPGEGKPPVTLGTKNFPEAVLLGHLYGKALEAKGWEVEVKENIGATEVTDRALTNGTIDVYPEYTGTILTVVAGDDSPPDSAGATYRQARRFQAGRGYSLLEPTPFENRDAIAVTKQFSQDNGGLETLADLKPLGATVVLGASPEFRTRFAGLLGLEQAYGLDRLKYRPLPISDVYKALDAGEIQAADVFTTDGQLASGKYVVLTDPKAIFGFQHVAPVVSDKVVDAQGAGFSDTLNAVSAKLTNEVMQKLNRAVSIDGQDPAAVAAEFLGSNGLA